MIAGNIRTICDRPGGMYVDEFVGEEHVATGWDIKPEGACKGDVCVPIGADRDAFSIAKRLGMAVVTDHNTGLVALGPASLSGHALDSAEAPDVVLHDLDGNEVALSQFRGEKVVIVSWAPY